MPPVLFANTKLLLFISIFMPVIVLMSETASAPPASAALAISAILVTFGESFMITGFAYFLISLVIVSTPFGSVPKAIPPSLTLGHEIFISIISIGSSARRFTTSRYSSSE